MKIMTTYDSSYISAFLGDQSVGEIHTTTGVSNQQGEATLLSYLLVFGGV